MRWPACAALALSACSGDTPGTGPGPGPVPVTALQAVPVVEGLSSPVFLTAPRGDGRLFVVEQPGRIRVIRDGQLVQRPFLDISAAVASGGERGLLSMAFDPDYPATGHFWVNYTDLSGHTRIERYRASAEPDVADPASAHLVLTVAQPQANHNGGQIAFGPDGMLYIGMGDGGGGGDPLNHGQNRGTLLGALLRIDVRSAGQPYSVPADNPFPDVAGVRPEIWAWGLRNPWRFSFDPVGGHIIIADVGQNQWEEINARPLVEAGLNYGWNVMEGRVCFGAATCSREGLTEPVHVYGHAEGCSVTGGYVYRGERLTGLQGLYFYSDFCRGWLRSFRLVAGAATDHRDWSPGTLGQVLSFGVDAAGELYVLTSAGRVLRLEPR